MADLPKPTLNEAFIEDVKHKGVLVSIDGEDRLFRSHGSLGIYDLRLLIPFSELYGFSSICLLLLCLIFLIFNFILT